MFDCNKNLIFVIREERLDTENPITKSLLDDDADEEFAQLEQEYSQYVGEDLDELDFDSSSEEEDEEIESK